MATFMSLNSIPEALDEVTRQLSKRDLLGCVQVSKTAYAAFHPALWRSLDLDSISNFLSQTSKEKIFVKALSKYGAFVRELTCDSAEQNAHLLSILRHNVPDFCQHLNRVRLTIPTSEVSQEWHHVLFQNNPDLTSVTLINVEWLEPLMPDLLTSTNVLRRLSLGFVDFCFFAPIFTIIECSPRLESLRIEGIHALSDTIDLQTLPQLPSRPTRIRELCLVLGAASTLLGHLLPFCPQLTSLEIMVKRTFAKELRTALRNSTPSTLTRLMLCHDDKGSDSELASILEAVPASQLVHIHIQGCRAGGQTLRTIVDRHGAALEVLTVNSVRSIPDDSVIYILTRCHQLREIEINNPRDHPYHVDALILERESWACINLEVFRIPLGTASIDRSTKLDHMSDDFHDYLRRNTMDTVNKMLDSLSFLRERRTTCQCSPSTR